MQIGGVKKLIIEVNEVDPFKIDEILEKKAADKKAGGAMDGKSIDDDSADSSSQSHSQATEMLDYREEERSIGKTASIQQKQRTIPRHPGHA